MHSYTVYNRAGGQGKSVMARDLAAVHAEQGDRVLIIDLDAQEEALSQFYGVDYDKNDPEVDKLTLHIMGRPNGPFEDLIYNVEPGVDIIPRHEQHNDLGDILDDMESLAKREVGGEFNRYAQLARVLKENNVADDYDVLICDPNAKADECYYSALYATRNVLIPAEASPKGVGSIDGVYDTASNFADWMDVGIGNLGVVATRTDNQKNAKEEAVEQLRDEHNALCYFKDLSVFDDAMRNRRSVYAELEDADRIRKSQENIIPKYRTLLAHIKNELGDPLPASATDEYEFWTGDEFWGDIKVPTDDTKIMEAK